MELKLSKIPEVHDEWEQSHRVRALTINGKSPFMDVFANWKSAEPADYKKIMKVMERVARLDRVRDEKHVKADDNKSGIYEMRAHTRRARVLFFYDDDTCKTAICVHTYWKGAGNQETAFEQAVALMKLWQASKETGNPKL
ncbi:MAG: hypothetical protein JJU11_03810 [Candidatus Sumerlaeia bacterium]|nr:hypothetical protein [Candidatus Sumerlaeia bacterium]